MFRPQLIYPIKKSHLIMEDHHMNRVKGLSLLVALVLSGFLFCTDARAEALEDALDNPLQPDMVTALTFSTSGAAPWTADTTTFYSPSNGASARSGVIGNSAYSSLTTTVSSSGPATLSFYEKVSSQATYDGLSFILDNSPKYKITGPGNWHQRRYALAAGVHTLEWKYSKNGGGTGGVDAAWVDKVIVSPFTRVQLLTPNGGGLYHPMYHPGDSVGITWTAPAGIDNFKLYYTVNNGLSYALIGSATGTSYTWTVPPINGNKAWCRVRVIGFTSAAAAVSVGSDVSDAPFTIEVLKVNAPNGVYDSPTGGASVNINYTLGSMRTPASSVLFYYTMDGAVTWRLIGTDRNIPAGDHTHPWTVPTVSTARTKCKVRIVAKSLSGAVLATDTSDSFFTIYAAPPLSSNKLITSFLFTNATATVTIDQTARIIEANVATGTSVTALVTSYVTTGQLVSVNTVTQASGVTPNDFTTPVTYTVVAADATSQNYTVFVTIGPLNAEWARTPSLAGAIGPIGYADASLYSLVTGTDSSVVGAGTINGYATFVFSTLVTAEVGTYSGDNGVLVKYDGSGTPKWATAVSVPILGSTSKFVSLATSTTDGSLYAAGSVNGAGPFDFGNGQTVAPSFIGNSVLLVKYDSAGHAQWSTTVSGGVDSNDDSSFSSVAAALDGSVYAAGFVYSDRTFDFGNGKTVTGSAYDTGVLVKYDSDGAAQWVQNPVAYSSSYTSVMVAPDGSVYAAGDILSDGTGTVDFGNGVAVGVGPSTNAAVLVKYDSAGAAQWARTVSLGLTTNDPESAELIRGDFVYWDDIAVHYRDKIITSGRAWLLRNWAQTALAHPSRLRPPPSITVALSF